MVVALVCIAVAGVALAWVLDRDGQTARPTTTEVKGDLPSGLAVRDLDGRRREAAHLLGSTGCVECSRTAYE
jgi:hypothetical protein